jgi:putative ribosome biogenesis GTPase RsgA
VRAAVAQGTLAIRRYELFVRLLTSIREESRPRRE